MQYDNTQPPSPQPLTSDLTTPPPEEQPQAQSQQTEAEIISLGYPQGRDKLFAMMLEISQQDLVQSDLIFRRAAKAWQITKETLKTFKAQWKAFYIKNRKVAESPQSSENEQKIDAYGFFLTSSGLYNRPKSKDGDIGDDIWICSRIEPVAHLRNTEGKDHALLVKVSDGEVEHLWAMPRRLLGISTAINEVLLGLNQKMPLGPSTQKLLLQYLMFACPKKKMRCVDKAGWHGDQYVFADGTVIGSAGEKESVYPVNETSPRGIRSSGTLKQWCDNVFSLCISNSRMIFSVGVAFSSICLELVGEDSGGFNFRGRSSIGKTKCLNVAVSVFGSPEFKRSWKTTANGLEGVCALHNDCLLPLDEFGQADANEVGEISYMISQGMGKQRAYKNASPCDPATWRVMMLSTGEVGLEEHIRSGKKTAKAGQQARIADIPAEIDNAHGCFEHIHDYKDGAEFSEEVGRRCKEYYGVAGKAFAQTLVSFGISKAKTHLKYVIDDFVADNTIGCDGQVKRVARRFALVYASLTLAIKFGVLGDNMTDEMAKDAVLRCYRDWLGDRGTIGDLESHNVVEQVVGLLQEHEEGKFSGFNESLNEKIRLTKWGYKRGSEFFIFPKAFNENLCAGFNAKGAAKILMDSGMLRGSGGKSSRSERIPAHNKQPDRFYCIDLNKKFEDE